MQFYCYCGSQYAWTLTDHHCIQYRYCNRCYNKYCSNADLSNYYIEKSYGNVPIEHQPDSHGALGVPQRGR